MKMKEGNSILFTLIFVTFLRVSYGCQMEGVTLWLLPVSETILDMFNGTVISRSTSNIDDIINVSYGESTLSGPYFDVELVDSQFTIRTNHAYAQYEENEVASMVSLTVEFRCTSGPSATNSLIFLISITDTNNNPPRFIPTNEIEFVVTPPLPPGYLLTGCLNDIIVRDIDLTTQRIEFSIEDNPYFEIGYDASASTEPKEFIAVLRTTTFIRSLPESLTLTISATDVDLTDDPPLTSIATLRITSDAEFQFPDEPVFTQTFYLANYTDTHQLNLETISLKQGFDEYVIFSLEGEYANSFRVSNDGDHVLLEAVTPLPSDIWSQGQIYLILQAIREYTSGDTATIIVQFPEELKLEFDKVFYEGAIINNTLQLSELVLSQGYQGNVITAEVVGEYSNYFSASVESGLVTLLMQPLTNNIINDKNFISIQVVAKSDRNEATTVVTLDIVKDDNVTPVFDKSIYSASYDTNTGLNAEPINFVQGFDETVDVRLNGEYSNLFQINQDGNSITLTSSAIPPELFSLQSILITLEASKPRTVGANAAITIALPPARELEFEESIYRGTIEDNQITLQTILLSRGYDEGVTFAVRGEYAIYFAATNTQNSVLISLSDPLPDTVITQNNVIILTLTASGTNAVTTSTSILLDVIKQDSTTPVFSRNIYYGTYLGTAIEIGTINLAQGYDTGVTFRLDGAHAQYFSIRANGNNAVIELQSDIPEEVIFDEKVLVFNVLADKPLTVGANTAVLITFPTELTHPAVMKFSKNAYVGHLDENGMSLENVILETGYENGTEFLLTGDYSEHFYITSSNNVVQVISLITLPEEVKENNALILLDIEARRSQAVSAWTSVVVNVAKQDIIIPVFNQAYYTGEYSEDNGLKFEENINLLRGYDQTVTFALDGEWSNFFRLVQDDNNLILEINSTLPAEAIQSYNYFIFTILAEKQNVTGRAVIVIDLSKEYTADTVILSFDSVSYLGSIENDQSTIPDINLSEGYNTNVTFELHGELANYFRVMWQGAQVSVTLVTAIPELAIPANRIIVLELQASAPRAVTAFATIVIHYVSDEAIAPIVELIFSEIFYSGSYSAGIGLSFSTPITLTQGYDPSVVFALEGDNAQWFGLEQNGNMVRVVQTSVIPAAVLSNNQQLVFVVTAQRPDSSIARATVVISLLDEHTEISGTLGFDRVTYLGSIENNQLAISNITLSEGYTNDVVFELYGELANNFNAMSQGAVVTITLQTVIPDQAIPANRIIVLELQASAPGAMPTSATIVIHYVMEEATSPSVELIFAETYYSGSYSAGTGLSFPNPITLSQGYDSDVVFSLEGENAQWFGLEENGNTARVVQTSVIPAGILTNHQQLVFVVTAQRPGSATARATVIISLIDESTENSSVLGFDRVTYLGFIENDQLTIPEITLSEGYTTDVVFELYGDLANNFNMTSQGAVVTITLQTIIPDQVIPANRIIVLELQASAPGSVPAAASIVIQYVMEEVTSSTGELIFAETFYSGSYSAGTGLSFLTPMTLTQGYDSNVIFGIEGDNSQWFGLEQSDNSVWVVQESVIPAAILANNQQFVFVVTAQRPGSATARVTVVISLTDEHTEQSSIIGFDRVTYVGSIENNQSAIPDIILSEGYTADVMFEMYGELANYFNMTSQGAVVTITLQTMIPDYEIPANRIIVLELQASAPGAIPASASIVIHYVMEKATGPNVELIFAETFYSGSYNAGTELSFPTPITLTQGYDSSVLFALEGENAQWFGLEQNVNLVTVVQTSVIPAAVLANNQQLVFVVTAQRPGSATARATVIISLIDEHIAVSSILGFDRVSYLGSIENGKLAIPDITISEGYTIDVKLELYGELADYFNMTSQGAVVTITLYNIIPEQAIPINRITVLELQASAPGAVPASTTIVIYFETDEVAPPTVELIFAETFYSGSYSAGTGLSFPTPITLTQGYDSSVVFALEGENAQWFGLEQNDNSVRVVQTSVIPAAVLANNQQLVFVVTAQRPSSATARATVIISLIDDHIEFSGTLGFDRVSYLGSIENGQSVIPDITISEGYTTDVVFELYGELANYFNMTSQGAVVTITLQTIIPEQVIPESRIIVLEIQASAPGAVPASAAIVIHYITDEVTSSNVELIFAETFYSGSYSAETGLSFPTSITLTQGYDLSVVFALEGVNALWFGLEQNGNSVILVLSSEIPAAVLANNHQLVFVVTAQRPGSATARATVIIELDDDLQAGSDVGFEKVLFEGVLQNGVVSHETISVIGISHSNVKLYGEYSTLFEAQLSNNSVIVQTSGTISIPAHVGHVVLELRAGSAAAVLILNVIYTEIPSPPTVTFRSPSYAIRTNLAQTGLIGRVEASVDNGEPVIYQLLLDIVHLEERLRVNSDGELHLSAPVNIGSYTFQILAIAVFSQATGTATAHLTVDAITECGGEQVMAPLIVLDVDEEEPHYNLMDGTEYEHCHFTLTNRWPLDQAWLYVDDNNGLHTTSIDREHESIAFMHVSQIQVEIILHCDGDLTRSKRSSHPKPYDYGSNKWALTDTIPYNPKRSFVNLIVNDINDNAPIFVGKELEPIAVGYPVQNLTDAVLPRSLIELQATDADIGENAALLYWSSAPELAVAPSSGFVHVRDGAQLRHGARLTVHATDRSGEGLTGSIDLVVRLLDESNIAVVTVRDAFLDDEQSVISHLSKSVGYEVRVLRSVVISDSEASEEGSRKRRDVTRRAGASLQLYIYGLIEREPVAVDRLTYDISNIVTTPVIIASSVSLQDHLEGQEICVIAGRDTGLLVATIVLSVVLFIVIVLIAVWFFLRWRRKKNYDQFSDENSLASRNESIDKYPRQEALPKPRIDIGELKKSERRLQEMLDAPVQVITEPTVLSSRNDAILNLPIPLPSAPIVIQSIDKLKYPADESSEDEFGENKSPRRKSVVTFNENVEKIIHVEDIDPEDISSNADHEIYKL